MPSFGLSEQRDPAVIGFLEGRRKGCDGGSGATPYGPRAGSSARWMTTADLSCASYVIFEDEYPYDWAESHPAITTWKDRIRSLTGWKTPLCADARSPDSRPPAPMQEAETSG